MGTHSDEDTHTLVVSIEKYDLEVPLFAEAAWRDTLFFAHDTYFHHP